MGQFRPLFVYFRLFYVSQFKRNLIKVTMVCLGFEPVAAEWKAQTNPKSLLSLYFFVSLLLLLSPSMFMFSLSVPLYLPIYCVFCSGPLSLFVHFPVFYYIMFLSSSLRVLVNFSWASVAQKKEIFQLSGRRFHGVAGLQPPSQRRKSGPTYL